MNHNDTLKEILIAVANNVLSYSHVKELIKITRVFASTFLKNHKNEAIGFAAKNGLDFSDLVEDTIAEIFNKGSNDELPTINKFIKSLSQSVEDINPKQLFLAYYSFIVKFVSLQLAKIYAEHDPNGAAIYKNIKGTVKNFHHFEIFKSKRGTIFIVKDCNESSNKNYIDYDEFLKKFLTEAQGRKNTRELLLIIHDLLNKQTDYQKEINIIDVVNLFKAYFRYEERIWEDDDMTLSNSNFSLLEATEIDQLVNKVTDMIKQKIFTDYYTKGKLSREQALGLADTINEILYDWIEVGKNGLSNYEYLNKFINTDKEEYNTTFKAKLEYLINLSKQQLKFYLEN